jgi:hypothetical protein
MSDRTAVHTVFGKHSRYDIMKVSGWLGIKFYIWKDGRPDSGSFSTLKAAVEAAEKKP